MWNILGVWDDQYLRDSLIGKGSFDLSSDILEVVHNGVSAKLDHAQNEIQVIYFRCAL